MRNDNALRILRLLLASDRPLSTKEITDRIGCDRKTVYMAIDRFEDAGFITDVVKSPKNLNEYSCKLRLEDL